MYAFSFDCSARIVVAGSYSGDTVPSRNDRSAVSDYRFQVREGV